MDEKTVDRLEFLASLPTPPSEDLTDAVRTLIGRIGRKVVVLDDDPTGTQTVHDIPVVTCWSADHLARELQDPAPASYVLTNSRSLDQDQAIALCRQIAANLREAARKTDRDFTIVSRSDSTLRGHFPAEVQVLESDLGHAFDGWVLCPYFGDGGRLTIGDVHYVAEGDKLVPASQTPFARDSVFGYRSSNLRSWIVEKSGGRIQADRITSLSIQELRSGRAGLIERKLSEMRAGVICIVNAADPGDLQAAVRGFLAAEADGKRFLYRTAASFVAARAGIAPRLLLDARELAAPKGRGILIVVGSYVPTTTGQLEYLLHRRHPAAVELPVEALLKTEEPGRITADASRQLNEHLAADAPVVMYTSRRIIGGDRRESLAVGKRVSRALVEVVRSLAVQPRALVGKGGVTSSDLATAACGVERATVLGQILPGVPVWRCGPESRFPQMPLVVFPGNVGPPEALAEVLDRLQEASAR